MAAWSVKGRGARRWRQFAANEGRARTAKTRYWEQVISITYQRAYACRAMEAAGRATQPTMGDTDTDFIGEGLVNAILDSIPVATDMSTPH